MVAVVATLLVVAGCGDLEVKSKADDRQGTEHAQPRRRTPAPVRATGSWASARPAAPTARPTSPPTSPTTPRPGRPRPGSSRASRPRPPRPTQAALLVSADRNWAIPDTGISRAEERSGKLKVYSLTDGTTKVVDIRDRAGKDDVRPIGWAFDPERADTLRVVDTKNRVWVVNVAGGKATQEGSLPKGPWVFTNGFNPNTGKPWVESITDDRTKPAGNGVAFKSPVTREGGTVLANGSEGLSELPASPCRLGAAYTDDDGVTWAFCADQPTLRPTTCPRTARSGRRTASRAPRSRRSPPDSRSSFLRKSPEHC